MLVLLLLITNTIKIMKRNISKTIKYGFASFRIKTEEVKISFKDNDITVISGTNGVGKTNIFHFIKWILCVLFAVWLGVSMRGALRIVNYDLTAPYVSCN